MIWVPIRSTFMSTCNFHFMEKYGEPSKITVKFDARKLCCSLSKIQTKRPSLRVLHGNNANGIANSEDPDQTAPLGAV